MGNEILMERPNYVAALDGLRAFAVLAVLAYHSGTALSSVPGGIGGVDIFFVISGFVITRGLRWEFSTTQRIALGRFYGRRAIRLFPALLVVVAVTAPIWYILARPSLSFLLESLGALTYLTPVANALLDGLDVYSHTWTLAIEEYFYLVLPFVLIYMGRKMLGRRTIVSVFMLVGLGMLISIGVVRVFTDSPNALLNYYLRAGALFLGCAVAVMCEVLKPVRRAPLLTGVSALGVILGMIMIGVPRAGGFGFLIIDISTMVLIICLVNSRQGLVKSILEAGTVRYIGRISYEIYLWHLPLLVFGYLVFKDAEGWAAPVAYGMTLFLAVATHHLLVPLQRRLRARLSRGRKLPQGKTADASVIGAL